MTKTKKTRDTLTYEDIGIHAEWLQSNNGFHNKKNKFSAIKKYMKYLKFKHGITIYDDYIRDKEITQSDMFLIKKAEKPKNDKKPLTKAEIKKLFKATSNNPRDYAIMMLFYHSAQRGGTIEFIDKDQIDFVGEINPKDGQRYHKIENIHAKNDFVYNVWVETECIDAINRYLEDREDPKEGYRKDNYRRKKFHKDAIFLNGNGQRLEAQSMRHMMKRYGAKIRLKKNIYNHLWRTSVVTILDGEGLSLAEIMNRTGHTNVESIKPYLQPPIETSNKKSRNALSLDKPKPEPKSETETTQPKPEPEQEPKPKPEIEQPSKPKESDKEEEEKTDRYITLLRDGLINKDDFMRLVETEKKTNPDRMDYIN